MKSLLDLHNLYVKTDTILLSSVFESFRNMCMKQYGLDPCHLYTSPGLSWSRCLKMSGVQLELSTCIDMLLMIESGIRRGISQISHRYAKANHQYVSDYGPNKSKCHLMHIDANSLYGQAMQAHLPVRDFTFLESHDTENFDVTKIPEHGETGYILKYYFIIHQIFTTCIIVFLWRRKIELSMMNNCPRMLSIY